jgi:hypothetical protein
MNPKAYMQRIEERDALVTAARELLLQIDDGPRDCYGTELTGAKRDVWKGSFLSRVERLRALVDKIDDPR